MENGIDTHTGRRPSGTVKVKDPNQKDRKTASTRRLLRYKNKADRRTKL